MLGQEHPLNRLIEELKKLPSIGAKSAQRMAFYLIGLAQEETEKLADAIYKGGCSKLKKEGWPEIGIQKYEWAEKIGPLMDVDNNQSKSFQVFRDGLKQLSTTSSI